jgi:uncharacterized protein
MQETSLKDAQNGALLCHLGGLIGSFITAITFGGAVGALLFWLIGREKSSFIDAHGREALNFQLSLLIYAMATVALCFVGIGILLLPALFVAGILFPILAAAAASRGEHYRSPITIRFF